MIWFDEVVGEGFHIITMNGATEEPPLYSPASAKWDHGEQTLGPDCFTTIWLSGDNYQEYDRFFSLEAGEDWNWSLPGEHFGRDFPFPEPADTTDEGNLTKLLSACSFKTKSLYGDNPIHQIDGSKLVEFCHHDKTASHNCQGGRFYEILGPVALARCQASAPHVEAKCLSAFVLHISLKNCGAGCIGSMGPPSSYAAYGLFESSARVKYVVPLVNFLKKNSALNFLER